MPYDFITLSPADFEDLSTDVIGRELGIRFDVFAAGPDGGADGRHTKAGVSTILQAKHYAKSPFSALKSQMAKERTSIEKLRPDTYILTTSCRITAANKSELVEIIGGAVSGACEVYGPRDFNGLLRKFPEVEKSHIKLWLSGAPVLERVLRAAAHAYKMTDLLAGLFALLPLFAATAIWYGGADYWPSAVYFHLAAFAGATAVTLMIIASWMTGRQTRAAIRLLAYACLPLVAAGAIWPYVWLVAPASQYALEESARGQLAPSEAAVWSRSIDVYAHFVRNADFHLASVAIFVVAIGLIIFNVTAVKKMWRTLFPKSRRQEEGPWTAAFVETGKIQQLMSNPEGMPIGIIKDRILRYEPVLRVWPQGHHFVIAGTRAGKFVSAGKPAVLDHPGSIVALDLKGEIYTACHAHRSQTRRQVVLDPYGVLDAASAKFDPFAYLRPDHLHRDIGTFVDGCIKPTIGEFQWVTNGCLDIARAAIEDTMLEDQGDDRFLRVIDKLLSANRLDTFDNWAKQTDAADGRIAAAAANLLDLSDRQRGSILDELRQNLVWAQNPMMRSILTGNDFTFDDVVAGSIDLYLVVPPDALREASGFMRLLMNFALGAFLRGGVERTGPDCLFVYDEFTRLGRLDKVIDVATIAAGYNVTAMVFAQNLDSVREIYGASTMTLIGSCATTRIFGLGAGDVGTAKWLSEAMGTGTARTETYQDAKMTSGETGVPLLDVAEILQLPADEQIILFRGNPPARTKLIISHEHPLYRDRMPQNA